ncbi:MAG: thioesterase family protein [Bacteroidales bacterium]
MYVHDTKIRIRYGETDQMGYVYYGRYAEFFEIGRTELIRAAGLTYRDLEEQGILLPVTRMEVKYIKPVGYDEQITIRTTLKRMPSAKITFHYQIISENGEVVNEAVCDLVFTSSKTRRPVRPPKELLETLQPFFT